ISIYSLSLHDALPILTAARMVGLDICGVDIVATTVHLPLEAQHGGVVEVNAAPGLRMHLNPSFGKGRAVGEAIINSMFAEGEDRSEEHTSELQSRENL